MDLQGSGSVRSPFWDQIASVLDWAAENDCEDAADWIRDMWQRRLDEALEASGGE